jgi:hypothetical protein
VPTPARDHSLIVWSREPVAKKLRQHKPPRTAGYIQQQGVAFRTICKSIYWRHCAPLQGQPLCSSIVIQHGDWPVLAPTCSPHPCFKNVILLPEFTIAACMCCAPAALACCSCSMQVLCACLVVCAAAASLPLARGTRQSILTCLHETS